MENTTLNIRKILLLQKIGKNKNMVLAALIRVEIVNA